MPPPLSSLVEDGTDLVPLSERQEGLLKSDKERDLQKHIKECHNFEGKLKGLFSSSQNGTEEDSEQYKPLASLSQEHSSLSEKDFSRQGNVV